MPNALKIALAVTLIAGVAVLLQAPGSGEATSEPVATVDTAQGAGPLDGMVFEAAMGPQGEAKDVADTFVFADGTFVSRECELRCNYPARPYFVRRAEASTEFVSETRCPNKDAKIVWRGTVEGDTITGVSTWTVRRWYWTVERKFAFTGQRATVSGDTR